MNAQPPMPAERCRNPRVMPRRRRTCCAGWLVVLVLALGGCAPKPADVSVLLITIDTLRADRVGAYGYAAAETPSLDRLAAAGTRFTQAMAQAPLTVPSHASIFTGTCPPFHGVRNNGNYVLADAQQTLAETLKGRGYVTGAVVSAAVLDHRFGLAQGFDAYDDDLMARNRRAAAEGGTVSLAQRKWAEECRGDVTTAAAVAWLRAQRGAKSFLWVHYYDPHDDYDPPSPYRERHAAQPYDGEVAFADACVGRLLDALQQLGLHRRTLVILMADHGEGLGDHGETTHGYFNYDTTVRIPLIVSLPGVLPEGRAVPSLVRSVDVLPTVLDTLGLPPPDQVQGASLLPLIRGRAAAPGVESYAETLAGRIAHDWSTVCSLRSAEWKYIHSPSPELYHLTADPGENDNLALREPVVAAAMHQRLRALLAKLKAGSGTNGRAALSAESRRQLESLGYVAGATTTASADDDALAPGGKDPKDMKSIIYDIREAMDASARGDHEQAATRVRQVLRADPDNITMRLLLIRSLFERGKPESNGEILSLARDAAQRRPDVLDTHVLLSRAAFETGDLALALAEGEKAVALQPSEAEPHYNLALYYQAKGDVARAEALLQKAIALDAASPVFPKELGGLYYRQGAFGRAVGEFRKALALAPADPDTRAYLGMCLIQDGHPDLAVPELQRALQEKPDHAQAHMALGVAWIRQGLYAEACASLAKSVELDAGSADAWYNLAAAQSRAGRLPAALVSLQTAIRLGGDRYRILARTHKDLENLSRAAGFRELVGP